MKSARLLLVALLTLAAIPLAAQVNDTYVIPAATNASGFNSRWMTQFSVFNPQPYALNVSVVLIPTGGSPGLEALFNVPSNAVAFSDNIILDLFNLSSRSGALLVATFPEDNPGVPDDTLSRSFLVTSNTYNNLPSGTYGQTIPGVWSGLQDFKSDEISAVAHGIRHSARLGYRTNVGAVNLGRVSTTMRVKVFDIDGRLLDTIPFPLPPLGHIQSLMPIELDGGSLEFIVDDPYQSAVVFPYTSTIDQLSGDPVYQSPTLLASASILYGKGAVRPTELGKKLDTAIAREVRKTAVRTGQAHLSRSTAGYRITK